MNFYYKIISTKTDKVLDVQKNTCAGHVKNKIMKNKKLRVFIPVPKRNESYVDRFLKELGKLGFEFTEIPYEGLEFPYSLPIRDIRVFDIDVGDKGRAHLAHYSAIRCLYYDKIINHPRNFLGLIDAGMKPIEAFVWAHIGNTKRSKTFRGEYATGGYLLVRFLFNGNYFSFPKVIRDEVDFTQPAINNMMVVEYEGIYHTMKDFMSTARVDKEAFGEMIEINNLLYDKKYEDVLKRIENFETNPIVHENNVNYGSLTDAILKT